MGLFSIVGATAALESGTSFFNASLLGVVTGTFGGVMGDVICNRVPSLFRPAPYFATCSFVGCWVFFLFRGFPMTEPIAAAAGITFVVVTRLLAIRFDWSMPALSHQAEAGTASDTEAEQADTPM